MNEPESLIECVPNVSEGRDRRAIERMADAIAGTTGVHLLDVHSDPDHHRTVFTFVGGSDAVGDAAFRLASVAVAAIDMRRHRGVHPRMGAVDVVPFIPLGVTPMQECVSLAHRVGRRIGESLGVPVYFYGEAALRAERRSLAEVRRGEYEGLLERIQTDPARAPDAGPVLLGPAGAVAVGARRVLLAFNVHLRTADLAVAQAVAKAVRESSGGLPGVQALGLATSRPGIVQVSMNLLDVDRVPPHIVVERVRETASQFGVELAESELVGLIPSSAVLSAAAHALGLPSLSQRQVLKA